MGRLCGGFETVTNMMRTISLSALVVLIGVVSCDPLWWRRGRVPTYAPRQQATTGIHAPTPRIPHHPPTHHRPIHTEPPHPDFFTTPPPQPRPTRRLAMRASVAHSWRRRYYKKAKSIFVGGFRRPFGSLTNRYNRFRSWWRKPRVGRPVIRYRTTAAPPPPRFTTAAPPPHRFTPHIHTVPPLPDFFTTPPPRPRPTRRLTMRPSVAHSWRRNRHKSWWRKPRVGRPVIRYRTTAPPPPPRFTTHPPRPIHTEPPHVDHFTTPPPRPIRPTRHIFHPRPTRRPHGKGLIMPPCIRALRSVNTRMLGAFRPRLMTAPLIRLPRATIRPHFTVHRIFTTIEETMTPHEDRFYPSPTRRHGAPSMHHDRFGPHWRRHHHHKDHGYVGKDRLRRNRHFRPTPTRRHPPPSKR